MKQKILYTFNVTIKEGDKDLNYSVGVLHPKRSQRAESELFYSEVYHSLLKRGIMPAAVTQKKLLDLGVVTDDEQNKRYEELAAKLAKAAAEYRDLAVDLENTEKNKERLTELTGEIAVLEQKCLEYEGAKIDAGKNSAESFAFQDTVRWLVVNLAVFKNADDEKAEFAPLFKGTTDKERFASMDDKEDAEDKLYIESLVKLYKACAFIYSGQLDAGAIKKYVES